MSIQSAHPLSDCGPKAENTGSSTLPAHKIHSILSNQRRYLLLEELVARDGRAEFDDLVEVVVVRELGIGPEHAEWAKKRKTVRTSLYQTHMKRLKDHGVVDFRSKTGVIQFGDNAEAILPYLEAPAEPGDSAGLFDRLANAFGSIRS